MTSVLQQPNPIVVTGVGAITALGADIEQTWSGLLAGQRGIRPIERFATSDCRVTIAASAPDPELPSMVRGISSLGASRTARLGLHAAAAALTQAGYSSRPPRNTALILGSSGAGDATLERFLDAKKGGRFRAAWMTRYPKRTLTDAIGAALHLDGPRAAINTACSSSLVAIGHAVELLRAGFCDVALAGGADELTRYTLTGFCSLRAVDPEPCRPFDVARKGMSLGEGAGVLVLESLERARARGAEVLAAIAGFGHSCDAGHLTAPDPSGHGAARAMRAALEAAGVVPEDVDFVNAHGTGTPHNDHAELLALGLAFGDRMPSCPIHSVKACIGHCMGAAGAIETIVALQSLRRGLVPPTPGLENPELPNAADFVRGAPRRVNARIAMTNSFGFGGNNAVLVLAGIEGAA